MKRKKASDFDPEVLNLFDRYVHGMIDRRGFLDGAAKYAVGGMTAAALLEALNPKYAEAQQVSSNDDRLRTEYLDYPSGQGNGTMRGYLVRRADSNGNLPGVLVVHENRGLNPHIEDVARRVALEGFLAFAPDALAPLGGYPGNDDDGRELFGQLDRTQSVEDFVNGAEVLKTHAECSGRIGVVGFCYGGGISNTLAVRIPDLGAAVPFYGGQPEAEDVSKIKASLLIHYGALDSRVNAGWPAYHDALEANNVPYTMHMYPDANHGFHNNTTPRYVEEAAKLAWERTIDFFNEHLR